MSMVHPLGACFADCHGCPFEKLSQYSLPVFHGLPQRIVDDPLFWNLGPDPFGFRVGARDAFACIRILDEALPVPNQNADIEFVVHKAVAPGNMPTDCRISPWPSERTANTVAIEIGRDCDWAPAGGEFTEYPADDIRLLRDDFTLAPDGLA